MPGGVAGELEVAGEIGELFHLGGQDRGLRDVLLAAQPTKRFVEVDEIAAVTAFLCSNDARSITGTTVAVDGGWTAH